MKVNIITLGCSKNTADSEHLAGHLAKAGFEVHFDRGRNDCDIIITPLGNFCNWEKYCTRVENMELSRKESTCDRDKIEG